VVAGGWSTAGQCRTSGAGTVVHGGAISFSGGLAAAYGGAPVNGTVVGGGAPVTDHHLPPLFLIYNI
jgi:hypothetical protein